MPLYEGIGLVGDKNPVIIDIGAAYCKCGFAGESAPRAILPSVISDPVSGCVNKVVDFNRPASDQFSVLAQFLHNIYFRVLLVNPKERRVLIVESVLCPSAYRDILANVLFKYFEVLSVLFAPAHLLACFSVGLQSQNALVVDVGHQECLVLPVFEGVLMLNCWEAAPVAAICIRRWLSTLLTESSDVRTAVGTVPLSSCPEILADALIDDIKVRACFVTSLSRSHQIVASKIDKSVELPPPPHDFDYPIEGDKILHVDGRVRELAYDCLFNGDDDTKGIPELILDSLLRCPIDLRRFLAERICVIGGTSMAVGFLSRLKAELHYLLETKYQEKLKIKTVKFFRPPSKANCTAWLGGSIFGALEILPHRSISREQFEQNPKVPDWTSFEGHLASSGAAGNGFQFHR